MFKETGQEDSDLLNTAHKAKDRATWMLLKTGDGLKCSGSVNSSCFACGYGCIYWIDVTSHMIL